MTAFLQNCLNGISIGSIYALIAIGYTMVYGILRLINFAHGDIFMMAGYFMIICMTDLLIPWYISLLLVVLFTVLLRRIIDRIAYNAASRCAAYVHHDLGDRRFVLSAELCHLSLHGAAKVVSVCWRWAFSVKR